MFIQRTSLSIERRRPLKIRLICVFASRLSPAAGEFYDAAVTENRPPSKRIARQKRPPGAARGVMYHRNVEG